MTGMTPDELLVADAKEGSLQRNSYANEILHRESKNQLELDYWYVFYSFSNVLNSKSINQNLTLNCVMALNNHLGGRSQCIDFAEPPL